jgi:hypothetical protein
MVREDVDFVYDEVRGVYAVRAVYTKFVRA